jgi:hypothetical protein
VTLRGEDENWRIGQRREHEEDEHEEDGGGGEMVYHSSPSVPGGSGLQSAFNLNPLEEFELG